MTEEDEKKKQPSLFKKDEIKWLFVGVLYILLITASRIDLIGSALIIFGYFAGKGIETHGLKLVEINITKEAKV
jgi:hypothetical protein